jgi:hypothetical protein
MKYISDYTCELAKLRNQLAEKEQEVASLQQQLAAAKNTIKLITRQPTTPSTPRTITPQRSPRDCQYARPTASSLSKAKTVASPEPPRVEASRIVLIQGVEYIYKSGVPLLAAPREPVEICGNGCSGRKSHWNTEGAYVAHFATATKASDRRQETKFFQRWPYVELKRGLRFASWQKSEPSTPASSEDTYYWDGGEEYPYEDQAEWPSSSPPNPAGEPETEESATAAATEADKKDEKADESLWETSRFEDDIEEEDVLDGHVIDHLAMFKLAEKTLGIMQASLLAAYPKRFEEEKYAQFIRLGRDELRSRFHYDIAGESLERNGYTSGRIRYEIEQLANLRNMLRHPHRWEFRRPLLMQYVLKQAQRVLVMIGDEKGAMEVRALRDELRDLVDRPLRVFPDFHGLSVLPFAEPMEFDDEIRGVLPKMLEENKTRDSYPDDRDQMLTDIATMWATQTDYQYYRPEKKEQIVVVAAEW